ncbi:MAG: hypothetical protein ACK5C0_02035 [Candidatus Kapaibacterium sp.]|jgi:hypothetical protein
MTKTKLFRALALLNFTVLLSIFLLYRNGSFDEYNYIDHENSLTSPNGGTPTTLTKDSVTQKSTGWNRTMLSSSKSAGGIVKINVLNKDTFNLSEQFKINVLNKDTFNLSEQLKRIINRFTSPGNTKTEKVSSDTLSPSSEKQKKK